jgi:hypothetical protein
VTGTKSGHPQGHVLLRHEYITDGAQRHTHRQMSSHIRNWCIPKYALQTPRSGGQQRRLTQGEPARQIA